MLVSSGFGWVPRPSSQPVDSHIGETPGRHQESDLPNLAEGDEQVVLRLRQLGARSRARLHEQRVRRREAAGGVAVHVHGVGTRALGAFGTGLGARVQLVQREDDLGGVHQDVGDELTQCHLGDDPRHRTHAGPYTAIGAVRSALRARLDRALHCKLVVLDVLTARGCKRLQHGGAQHLEAVEVHWVRPTALKHVQYHGVKGG
mmetsp:Transcript_43589/g.107853  ORF Transcript_43589/g.107853 Transcript_43589/m.107853 type:complete len:203 (-) Transcript_43589:202-810(-)